MTSGNEKTQAITLDGDGEDGEFVKEQQCVKKTRIWIDNSFSAQRWILADNGTLTDKASLWKSEDSWSFTDSTDGFIYIENTSKNKVLEATIDGNVIQKVKVEGKAHQLWKKGELDNDYSLTLINSGMPKLITAVSETGMEIKGNITLRFILLVDYLLIIYHVDFLHIDQIVKLEDYDSENLPNYDNQVWKVGEVFNDKYFTIKHYKDMKENTNSRPTIEKLKDTGYYLTANAMSNPIIKIKEGKKNFY